MNDGFKANPEGLIDKGLSVKKIYERYMEEKRNVDKAKNATKEIWEGQDSAKYVEAIESYEPAFKELGDIIQQIGNIMERHGSRLVESRTSIANIATKL